MSKLSFQPTRIVLDKVVAPASAIAFQVKTGQYWRITDIEGKQCGDLILFNGHDYSEKLSCVYTRQAAGRYERNMVWHPIQGITTGRQLMSTIHTPMAIITADTAIPGGAHDTFFRSCNRHVRQKLGLTPPEGCLELLTKALEPYGIAMGNIPDAFNVFMNTIYDTQQGMLSIVEPVTRPGDYIEFKAEMDLLCALSACPMSDGTYCNGAPPHRYKPLRVQILEEE